ncbi:MAG: class I SAM-dependent methyltransferase [Umezawaea sp.]
MTTRNLRFWNWASGRQTWIERKQRPHLHLAVDGLGVTGGESVLDLGCGTGPYLAVLREAVGPNGTVTGADFSPRMLAAAQRRIDANAWDGVTLTRVDATSTPLGVDRFDAAIAMTSLSAMPDIAAAVSNVHRALRPGGRLFVADVRPTGVARAAYRLLTGAPGEDVATHVRRRFASVASLNAHGDPTDSPTAATAPFLMLLATK